MFSEGTLLETSQKLAFGARAFMYQTVKAIFKAAIRI